MGSLAKSIRIPLLDEAADAVSGVVFTPIHTTSGYLYVCSKCQCKVLLATEPMTADDLRVSVLQEHARVHSAF